MADFSSSARDGIAARFAATAGVSTSEVVVRVMSASVAIEVSVTVAEERASTVTQQLGARMTNQAAANEFLSGLAVAVEAIEQPPVMVLTDSISPPPPPPADGPAPPALTSTREAIRAPLTTSSSSQATPDTLYAAVGGLALFLLIVFIGSLWGAWCLHRRYVQLIQVHPQDRYSLDSANASGVRAATHWQHEAKSRGGAPPVRAVL